MTKILTLSDSGVPSGYGRIHDEVCQRLVKRGYELMAASLMYDGLLPPQYEGIGLPYHVASLAGHAEWPQQFMALANTYRPDIVLVIQDAPYAMQVQALPLDWSRYALMVITPVDGAPIYPPWLDMLKKADGTMSISQFGVRHHKLGGVQSELCRPGINPDGFFALPEAKRMAVREQLGIKADAFVMGIVAQNQGRKDIPHMLEAFFTFAQDKPDARLLLNMERQSPAGWDLPMLCKQWGWDERKIIYRDDCAKAGVMEMRERYNVMDVHVVLSHREGFGLPLVEAQACGVVNLALDWCSGTEICGDGHGVLIDPIDYHSYSTWGGALDYHPDMKDFVNKLQMLFDEPEQRKAIAAKGMARARTWTWDSSVDNTVKVIERILDKRRAIPPADMPLFTTVPQPARPSVDGLQQVELLEA